jgi:hypothetical protein
MFGVGNASFKKIGRRSQGGNFSCIACKSHDEGL